jgi:hypothetical protein
MRIQQLHRATACAATIILENAHPTAPLLEVYALRVVERNTGQRPRRCLIRWRIVIAFTNNSGVNFGWRGGIKINVSPVLGSASLRRGYPTIVVAWHTQRVFFLLRQVAGCEKWVFTEICASFLQENETG